MEMQNITLSIPKKTIQKVKLLAIKRKSSISALVAESLEKLADKETGKVEAKKRLSVLIEKGFDLGYGSSKIPSREELHERR